MISWLSSLPNELTQPKVEGFSSISAASCVVRSSLQNENTDTPILSRMAGDGCFDDLCRICISGGGNKDNVVPIYSDEGRSHGLEDKIIRFLSIKISEEDGLPKVVCSGCRNKLDSIDNFCALALKSQATLTKLRQAENGSLEISRVEDDWKKDPNWWAFKDEADEPSEPEEESVTSVDSDTSKSLLHSILTKGQHTSASDVTEMEVTVDPMLFFEEEEDEEEEEEEEEEESPVCDASLLLEDLSGADLAQRVSEPKPYQCYLCPRGFNSDLSLKSHLWNHIPSRKVLATSDLNRHEVEGPRMFNSQCLCTECGRVYPSKSTLKAHQITHSNLRPHKCSLCDKTFKRNQDLKFHINQHTGERPYRCPYCPKAFASSGNCFSHRKRMHPKQLARDKKKRR